MTTMVDLPEDILAIVYTFLDAGSFLLFCQTCKDLYQYRQDPAFWRNVTSSTFRLPISPLLKADGARWYWLYKRLRTQTKLYTWGQGLKGNLGPGRSPQIRRAMRGPMLRPLPRQTPVPSTATFQRASSSWPTEAHIPDEVGVIADLQCGGWSTNILSSKGKLYTVGIIDAKDGRNTGEAADNFRHLEYLTQSTSAIRQFSSGRCHILALTDDGEILSWDRVNAKGLKVFGRSGRDFGGRATRVVAGWNESSAYVPETGLVYWSPLRNDQQDQMLDGVHVKERIVPGTTRRITTNGAVVEVATHVLLEGYIVWLTSDGILFACNLFTDSQDSSRPEFLPFEVPGYSSSARTLRDVQGQFRKFAVFTETGEVLSGNTDFLRLCFDKARGYPSADDPNTLRSPTEWSGLDELLQARPADNPALQHNQVISLAFGDHHSHALHVNGRITSYGNDPQSCGALGLGDMPSGARFRGLRTFQGFRPDSRLLPLAERQGRQIWFEPEKRDWLKYMEETLNSGRLIGPVDAEGNQRSTEELFTPNTQKQYMFSEWVEQEGRHWREGPLHRKHINDSLNQTSLDDEDFHLHPYFALAVSAAGWHSGALVLVDEEEAHLARQKWIVIPENHQNEDEHADTRAMPGHFEPESQEPEDQYVWEVDGFPRVKLPDGSEMPGDGELRQWRDGMPSVSDIGVGQ